MSQSRAQRRHPERHADRPPAYPLTAVAWIHAGNTAGEFTESIFDVATYDGEHHGILRRGGSIRMQSSPRLAAARCTIVREFLKLPPDVEYLLFIDADMQFTPDTPYRMIASAKAHGADILGGLCFVGGRGSDSMYPTIYVLSSDPEKAKNLSVEKIGRYPRGGVIGCDATGGAALLIHRSVLVKMGQQFARRSDGLPNPTPWFADGIHHGQEYGEDVVFCLRARQLGFKVVVDTNIQFGHVKSYVLTEELYRLHLMLTGQEDLAAAEDVPDVEEGLFDVSGPIRDQSEPTVVALEEPARCACVGSTEGESNHRDDCPEWPGARMGHIGAQGVYGPVGVQ